MGKRVVFFSLTSFALAVAGYYLLGGLLPGHRVFGGWYRMLPYHAAHPLPYIALCCGCYGLLAAAATGAFGRRGFWGRVGLTAGLCVLTVALSAPLGGMLWHWHDMRAGYFPPHWGWVLLRRGIPDGLAVGWLVVGLSVPYAWLGIVVCYFLTKAGASLFQPVGGWAPAAQRNSHFS